MRLADLHPTLHEGHLEFDCPVGHPHRIIVPVEGERAWTKSGEFPASLTLTPSILAHEGIPNEGSYTRGKPDERKTAATCGWHGWITAGEVRDA